MEKIMISEYWIWTAWLTKVLLYLGVTFILGGALCYFLLRQYLDLKKSILKYMTIGTGLGSIASILNFFILIGSLSNTGIRGMWNPTYINIMLNIPQGYAHILRSISFALLFLLMIVKLNKKKCQFSITEISVFGILLIPIILSFSQLGHIANLSLLAQILLSIHILVMSLWMGALYPLWKTSRKISGFPLKERIHAFGRIAIFIVIILIICGVSVGLFLFKDPNTSLNNLYGYGFIIKILFIMCILILAALNKWYFTPHLQNSKFSKHFSYAILFEMVLGLLILLTTGYITVF